MKPEEFTKAMTFLGISYNKEFTNEQVAVWYEYFKDDYYQTFKTAIKRLASKNKYMPSVAEIKKEIALLKTPTLQLDPDEEWETVLIAIRKYGYYNQEKAFETLKPITKNIVKTIGWYRLCSSESIQWERKEFIEIFKNKIDNVESIAMLNEPTMTLVELTRLAKEHYQIEEQKLLN